MKILLVKMSSMGDIFHTFPAITDLKTHYPEAQIDWVVEDGFKEIVSWHPAINKVIPIQLRRWMKDRSLKSWNAFRQWKKGLQLNHYDYIVDAQGLLKSAVVAKAAKGKKIYGYDKHSAREPISRWFYDATYFVPKDRHAVERTRQLFGNIFNYPLNTPLNFGINQNFRHIQKNPGKLIFIIGTSWITKLWSITHWKELTTLAIDQGYEVEIIWGSDEERIIAQNIIDYCPKAYRPPERMSITAIAEKLIEASGVIGLDTGFSHLAGALETSTIAIYGPTSPIKVGLIGSHTINLRLEPPLECMPCHKRHCKWLPEGSIETPPCMAGINANTVWNAFRSLPTISNT